MVHNKQSDIDVGGKRKEEECQRVEGDQGQSDREGEL